MSASQLISLECKEYKRAFSLPFSLGSQLLLQQHQLSHQWCCLPTLRHMPNLAATSCSFTVCLPQGERTPKSLPSPPYIPVSTSPLLLYVLLYFSSCSSNPLPLLSSPQILPFPSGPPPMLRNLSWLHLDQSTVRGALSCSPSEAAQEPPGCPLCLLSSPAPTNSEPLQTSAHFCDCLRKHGTCFLPMKLIWEGWNRLPKLMSFYKKKKLFSCKAFS